MKRFLSAHKSTRWGYDGWAIKGSDGRVLDWSVCSTRDECREVAREYAARFTSDEQLELFKTDSLPEIVKVRIKVEEIPDHSKISAGVQESIV